MSAKKPGGDCDSCKHRYFDDPTEYCFKCSKNNSQYIPLIPCPKCVYYNETPGVRYFREPCCRCHINTNYQQYKLKED